MLSQKWKWDWVHLHFPAPQNTEHQTTQSVLLTIIFNLATEEL